MFWSLPIIALIGCASVPVQEPKLPLCQGCDQTCDYENLPGPDRSHVEGGVDYPDPPPAGGDHDPCWAEWGVYEAELPAHHWVHNMEHGGVIFLYNCPDGCADEVTHLTKLVDTLPAGTVILTPYEALPTRFGMTSWAWRLTTDCWDPERFEAFYDAHVDNAPESLVGGPPSDCM